MNMKEKFFRGHRWIPILGLPYVFAYMVAYAEPSWFTVPTVVLVAIGWFLVCIDLIFGKEGLR